MQRRLTLLLCLPLILGGCEFLNPGVEPEDIEDEIIDEPAENCAPYLCMDGSTHPRCTEDGHVINYFAPPCMTSGGEQTEQTEGMMIEGSTDTEADMIEERPDTMMQKSEPAVAAKGSYLIYSAAALTNGQTKVLFFHAAWCPICRAAETDLMAWYGADGFPLSVYKVNYDTETELNQKYGVTYQHTFVKVDGQGNLIAKIQDPSDEELQAFLR